MIKAAFCDDDDTVLKELQSLLEEYRRERDYRIDAKVYHSPLDLLNEMEKGTRFDILFLDILMPGPYGRTAKGGGGLAAVGNMTKGLSLCHIESIPIVSKKLAIVDQIVILNCSQKRARAN